jgi:divalent metal cation (Fe/Co/Zn/Cd) transporter
MHIDLDPTLSFEAAHAIVVEAERRVTAAFPDSEVLIHADPRGVRPSVQASPWS